MEFTIRVEALHAFKARVSVDEREVAENIFLYKEKADQGVILNYRRTRAPFNVVTAAGNEGAGVIEIDHAAETLTVRLNEGEWNNLAVREVTQALALLLQETTGDRSALTMFHEDHDRRLQVLRCPRPDQLAAILHQSRDFGGFNHEGRLGHTWEPHKAKDRSGAPRSEQTPTAPKPVTHSPSTRPSA